MTKLQTPYCLLAVTGMSPQVITETLYALHRQGKNMPQRINIITTHRGKKQAWLTLGVTGKEPGMIKQFTQEYNLPDIPFSEDDIFVVTDKNGNALDDVLTEEEHQCMADFITQKVYDLTQDNKIALHASLAGGRKTMTFFMGYAMSLFGRAQDQLSHVLVSHGYEGLRDFFYPTVNSAAVEGRDRVILDKKDAVVTLARIPFVRLREDIPFNLLNATSSYSEVVKALNLSKQPPKLTLDIARRTITCSGIEIGLTPTQMAIYLLFARRAKLGLPKIRQPKIQDTYFADCFLEELAKVKSKDHADDLKEGLLKRGMDSEYYEPHKARLKKAIVNALGKRGAEMFLIQESNDPDPTVNMKVYGLNLPQYSIDIIE
jgi:CRISPR-associated protein (TIGR02584 family)